MAEKLYRNRFLLGAAGSVSAIHARIQEPLGKTKRNLKKYAYLYYTYCILSLMSLSLS